METLSKNDGLFLNLALSYGARDELIRASQKIAEDCLEGRLSPNEIDKTHIEKYLSTQCLSQYSDVDLLIRTSGEKRTSNFLLWESAYAELMFPSCFWPDYTVKEFEQNLDEFTRRERRYGGLSNHNPHDEKKMNSTFGLQQD